MKSQMVPRYAHYTMVTKTKKIDVTKILGNAKEIGVIKFGWVDIAIIRFGLVDIANIGVLHIMNWSF